MNVDAAVIKLSQYLAELPDAEMTDQDARDIIMLDTHRRIAVATDQLVGAFTELAPMMEKMRKGGIMGLLR